MNQIVGGKIPREFIPAVEKGFKNAMENGPLAGFPVQTMKVRLYDGSFHDVDSDSLSFELAAGIAFKEAAKKAGMKVVAVTTTCSRSDLHMADIIVDRLDHVNIEQF